MTFSTGIFLTLVRFYEPVFRYIFFQSVYEFWGEIYEDDKSQVDYVNQDALSSFLNSSLNVELVFIILESITKFASKGKNSKVIDREGKNVIAYERIDFSKDKEKIDLQLKSQNKLTNNLTLHSISIVNPDRVEKP